MRKKIVMSCNLAYPDEDSLSFRWDLITWLSEHVATWKYIELDRDLIFIFDKQEDAFLFKITYL